MNKQNIFKPTFGNRPQRIIGREEIINDFELGLLSESGHPNRASFLIGQRGTGKTALLLEFAERAKAMDFIAVRVTASERMLDEILQIIQVEGIEFIKGSKRKIKSVSAGGLGFSFGLTFSDEVEKKYSFRIKLTMLLDELANYNKGILLLVDEVTSSSPEMRELATTYQHLVGDGKNIAIVMAGLPGAVSSVLNDDILTFLNRARKVNLAPIQLNEIREFYLECFTGLGIDIGSEKLEMAVSTTRGYPYLLQLIGFYILKYIGSHKSVDDVNFDIAIKCSKQDLIENVFQPCLKSLSDKDIEFLKAMAEDDDDSMVANIGKRLGESHGHIQAYRKRLIAAGVIISERRGRLSITVPFLNEYLRGAI